MRPWIVALVMAAAALLPCCGDGGERGSGGGRVGAAADRELAAATLGPVSATLRTDAGEPRFGDRFRLVLEVTAQESARLAPLTFGSRLGHFRVRDRNDPPLDATSPRRWEFTVEPELTGRNLGKLPPIPFEVVSGEGAGTTRVLELPGFEMTVAGLPEGEQPRLEDAMEPLPPLPLAGRRGGRLTLWVAIVGTLLLAFLAVGWRFLGSRRGAATAAAIDPRDEARQALDALLASDLLLGEALDPERVGIFYVRLTGIVRRFIERTTGVDAPDQTTEEFLRNIDGHERFPPERREALATFLTAADLVKYAGRVPARDEIDGAVDAARAFCGLAASVGGEEKP